MTNHPRQIWKFELGDGTHATVSMPIGADIRHVAVQRGSLYLWAEVALKEDKETEPRDFIIVGTGNPIPARAQFVGTALTKSGDFVWHVYEETK